MNGARSNKELMLAGEAYSPFDEELGRDHQLAQDLLHRFNGLPFDRFDEGQALLRSLLGGMGEGAVLKAPFRCDYGCNVFLGARSFVNGDCYFLDCNRVVIGEDVQIGPRVQIYTPVHPIDPAARRTGTEWALPVTIEDGCWIGGGAVLCPGVTIGRDTVIGAGSVVTKSIPAHVVAAGNPARIVREI